MVRLAVLFAVILSWFVLGTASVIVALWAESHERPVLGWAIGGGVLLQLLYNLGRGGWFVFISGEEDDPAVQAMRDMGGPNVGGGND